MAGRWNDRLASWDSALGAGEQGAIKGVQNLGGAMSIPWVAKHTLLIARLVALQSPETREPRRNIQQNVSQKVRGQGTWPVQALAVQAGEAAAGFAKVPWTELSGVRKGLSAALACMAVIVPAQDLRCEDGWMDAIFSYWKVDRPECSFFGATGKYVVFVSTMSKIIASLSPI